MASLELTGENIGSDFSEIEKIIGEESGEVGPDHFITLIVSKSGASSKENTRAGFTIHNWAGVETFHFDLDESETKHLISFLQTLLTN